MGAEGYFTRSDGSFHFARWGRPIVPVIVGLDDAHLPVFKGAIEAVVTLAGHRMAQTDAELGANLMLFLVRDWDELADTSHVERMIPELPGLLARLKSAEANQYRLFRFDEEGAIRTCFAFVRVDAHLAEVPVETLALNQAVLAMLLWSDRAFEAAPALWRTAEGAAMLRPEVADVVRAAYDPVLPAAARDPAFALRLDARIVARGGAGASRGAS